MATRFAVGSNVRIYAAERYNLSADTRLLPATRMPARPNTLFWFFVDGTATVHHDGTELNVQAPCLLAMPEHWSEGAEGRRAARIQTAGAPYASVQAHVRQPCDGLRRIPLSYAHAEEIRSMHRRAIDTDGDEGLRVLRALLLKLVSFRIIPCDALTASDERFYTEPAVARMWQALRRRYTALDASPSLKAMAAEANLSTRHAHRLMSTIFSDCLLPPGGFREATSNLRLSLASILLSQSALKVHEVASIVGYPHPETLAGAFRHAGLQAPCLVKRTYATARSRLASWQDEIAT